ncbi:hypothetical protein H0A36_22460 [Endozoicomonas sp. SM1973]|uniref:Uncharacterized protein n=1 Tax=Spartinivicinus marinus TaxID=2994442 RepID=A0A853IFH2_9GAMM|nr:hypothetical protein [Spartinivicinus marinus]MCX4029066.1 hypothetical protein [Spartinivicinus marinus]NYZ68784.1 hypothetical protein [Spartinivicinus marinus]
MFQTEELSDKKISKLAIDKLAEELKTIAEIERGGMSPKEKKKITSIKKAYNASKKILEKMN